MCVIFLLKMNQIKFVFFGSSRFSTFVLDELEKAGYSPILNITSAKGPLPELPEADLFIVASFGKIIPQRVLNLPRLGCLNVHPSLLPEMRGPAPIQNLILGRGEVGVTIIKMDSAMDHGPILAQEKVSLTPWPDHYDVVEEKLARAGGQLLVKVLSEPREEVAQDDTQATYNKMIKKEDGLLDLNSDAETNYRKVLAYSTWPHAYFYFKKKTGEEVRVVVKDAEVKDGVFTPTRVIPAGKREMVWVDFLRGNS
jgi:methionyl-tRNA formyltransferase